MPNNLLYAPILIHLALSEEQIRTLGTENEDSFSELLKLHKVSLDLEKETFMSPR
jgi:hypothetical protein